MTERPHVEPGWIKVETPEGAIHACTVNGEDAQYWFDHAQRWKDDASDAYMRGRAESDRLWAHVTGFIDRRAYKDAHPTTRDRRDR